MKLMRIGNPALNMKNFSVIERSVVLPGYSLEELVGGELDGAVGEDADHLGAVPLVQRQEPLLSHHPHSHKHNHTLLLARYAV